MRKNVPRYTRHVRVLLLILTVLFSTSAFASHFRFGLITATRLSETTTTVTYRLNVSTSWRLGAPNGNSFAISGGNIGSVNVPMTFVTDPSGEWTNGTGTATVTLNKTTVPTRLSFSTCCKIGELSNNSNGYWDVYTVLNTGSPGSSPVSTLPAIINMPVNAASATYTIPASDPDPGSTLTYGVPNFSSGNLSGSSNPSGFSINSTTGQITFNTIGKSPGQLYNAMVTVTDNNGNQIMLDFIIKMVGASAPPAFDYSVMPSNGFVYNVIAGQNVSFPISVGDTDPGSSVSISASGLPSYITTSNFTPSLPATGNPAQSTFSWTPTSAQVGHTVIVNLIATDNVGVQSTTSVTVRVAAEPAPAFIGATPGEGTVRQIPTGVPHQDIITAQSSMGSNVSIAFANIPPGATLTPSVPTVGANPGQTIMNWTPSPADFGLKTFSYQATISSTPTIFATRTYSLLVNTIPVFTSTPPTTVLAGQPYSYNITVTDADLPFGDNLDIISAGLPSWLTLVDNGNGTATLSGTPSFSDGGNHTIKLHAEDLYHHGYTPGVEQEFTIAVSACNLSLSATSTNVSCPSAADGSVNLTVMGANGLVTYSWSNGSTVEDPASLAAGTYTVTITDAMNCSATTSVTVGVTPDVTAPVISCAFNITVNAGPGQCGAVVNYNAPSATDNCGTGTLPTTLAGHTYKGTFGGHTYFISNTPTDPETAHANAIALGGHLVTISNAAENAFVSAMSNQFIWIGLTDRSSEGTFGWVTSEPVSYSNWNSGEPNNYLGNEDWAVINWGPNGTWNDWFYYSTALYVIEFEGGNIPTSQVSGLGSGSLFPIGTTTETWQAVDASGNMATCSFTVTVIDNQGPVPTVANLPVINAECAVTVPAPTATDNCGIITATTTNPTTFSEQGTYSINWRYDDGNGHVVNQVQTVIVKDVTAPVVSCPSPISVNNDEGKCGAFVAVPAPVISDNCNVVCNTDGLDEYTVGVAAGKSPQWGVWPGGASSLVSTERYFSAPNSLKVTGHPNGGPQDQVFRLGNQTSGNWILSFRIFIPAGNTAYYNLQHTESLNSWAHEMKFHSNGTAVLRTNTGNTTFTYPQGQWIEVKQLIDQNSDQTSMYVNGVFIKSWQFSTHAGSPAVNNQLGAFNFFPVSNTNYFGSPEPNPTATPLYYIDDITLCGDATQIGTYVSRRYSKEYPVGTTPVAITISDLGGNKTVCNGFNVTVADAEMPTITSPAAVTVNADNGSCSATGVVLGTPVTADNCGVASVTSNAPASYPVGSTTVTWTVTDIHGNASTSTQKVMVVDNQNPVLTCTSDIFFCFSGTQYSIGTLGASDNCGIASIVYDITGATVRSGSGNNASGTFNVGTSTITWTVTDVNGNTSSCSSTVTINPPVSVAIPDASAYTTGVQPNTVYVGYAPAQSITYTAQPAGGTAPYTYSWSTGSASQTITVSPSSVGVHNYTVTITDAKGCTATFTKSVTVVDVRCGNKNDKVLVCHKTGSASNPYVQICVSANAVATHLANGSYLGACTNNAITRTSKPATEATARILMAYPNPSHGNFNLQLKGFSTGKVTVQVMNSLGKTVLVKEVSVSYAIQDESLDLKGVAAGIYQVRVVGADGVATTAVVIAR